MKQMFEITVDIQKETNHTDIKFSQNSLNTSELNINIANGGKEFTLLDSDKIIVYFKKPDQKVVFQDKQIEVIDKAKGKINVLLTTQTLIQAGKVYGEISIEREENGVKKRINTYDFSFEVRSSFSANESIESTNEFQVFDKILETGKVLKDVNVPALIESEKVATEAKEATVQLTNQIGILSGNVTEQSKKTDERPGVIPPPAKFPWKNPPIMIKKDIFGRYNVNFDIEKFVPAVGKAYYVDANTGIDTNDGLTSATAFKSFSKALQQADAKIIYVAPGVYDRNRGWIKTNPASNT
ncbi:BppU family phage baseplate upper protein, partial [Bacillus cereus group sp. MYBK222-1]|uniref:BppU family phage baseplate upper protein n=1 Tax=Bacillus cereus group sp. MYBK222-1 TaxID=3450659 RepID=UPI003F7A1DA6